jgi:hypothetical protein
VNLYFLVEGRQTERRVYEAWVRHAFPRLTLVRDVAEMTSDSYFIFCGNGYPSYLKRIPDSLADIRDLPSIDHFFVCVDSEDLSYTDKLAELQGVLVDAERTTRVKQRHPRLGVHIIVQSCCIETWFLGHSKMLRRNPTSQRLVEMKRFHDVSVDCPEQMGHPPAYLTRASFHLAYLQEMLREQDKTYSKTGPGVVLEANYLEALRQRCATTGHLPSLSVLLSTWDGMR